MAKNLIKNKNWFKFKLKWWKVVDCGKLCGNCGKL